ncbi:hypothetical protein [Streptococcus dentiloxodontae]
MANTRIFSKARLKSCLEETIYHAYEKQLPSLRFTILYPVDNLEANRILMLCQEIPAVLSAHWQQGTVILKVYLKH